MMMSLFSSFDQYFFLYASFVCMFFISILGGYFFNLSFLVSNLLTMQVEKMFLQAKSSHFSSNFKSCVFLLFFILNFSSIFPYNFPWTSQMSTVMFISLSIWLTLNLYYALKNSKMFVSHMIPEGCPKPLVAFLFLIEMVSNMIRPVTLSVRLVANILAGHILMILLAKLVFFVGPPLIVIYMLLNLVEFAVSLIQCYIFTVLVTLYMSELH
uniref:ATP synthase subunit a n=1 Tax=Leipothrix sp. 1 XFX-2017 TaxID=1955440 RepID=A0A1S5XVY0_9ACAR|nr:ATP synthase subunit 6 [Leipothrix sp. 1 XFX-2017]